MLNGIKKITQTKIPARQQKKNHNETKNDDIKKATTRSSQLINNHRWLYVVSSFFCDNLLKYSGSDFLDPCFPERLRKSSFIILWWFTQTLLHTSVDSKPKTFTCYYIYNIHRYVLNIMTNNHIKAWLLIRSSSRPFLIKNDCPITGIIFRCPITTLKLVQ